MYSHITVGVSDLDRATRFYDAILNPLGLRQRRVIADGGPQSRCWIATDRPLPRFYIYEPFDGRPASAGNGSMVAFLAPSQQSVTDAYAAGMALDGQCSGPPGPREHYGDGYFGAYLLDPDGNKIHLVHRGDLEL